MCFRVITVALATIGVGLVSSRADERANSTRNDDATAIKRGEYLANNVAHCVNCHTPDNGKGVPDQSRLLQGAPIPLRPKGKVEKWADESPDITHNGLAGKWSEADMIKFLTTGIDPDGQHPRPPMPVFQLNNEDARAVTLYLRSLTQTKR
jgi:mono/diheme cytochrome c family protein